MRFGLHRFLHCINNFTFSQLPIQEIYFYNLLFIHTHHLQTHLQLQNYKKDKDELYIQIFKFHNLTLNWCFYYYKTLHVSNVSVKDYTVVPPLI